MAQAKQNPKFKRNDPPGYFESHLPQYPGSIQFPNPMMLNHFKEYWDKSVTAIKGLDIFDTAHMTHEWSGAIYLLQQYGRWNIENVSIGDAAAGNLPLELSTFIVEAADEYIYPQLPAKKKAILAAL